MAAPLTWITGVPTSSPTAAMPGVVRGPQGVVVVAGVGPVGQLGRQADVGQGSEDRVPAAALSALVDPGAERGVEGGELLLPVLLAHGQRHPDRSPALVQAPLVAPR